MTALNTTKGIDLNKLKSCDSKKASTANNTKSNLFDNYLKSYSDTSNNVTKSSDNSNGTDLNANNDSKDTEVKSSKSNSNESTSSKNVLNDDVKDNEKVDSHVDDSKDSNTNEDVNWQLLCSLILKCSSGDSVDVTKLKSELEKLKIPEDLKKDIVELVSKIQDSLKNKTGNGFMKLLASEVDSESALNEHNKLVNNIIDILKSKVNATEQNVKTDKSVGVSDFIIPSKANKVDDKILVNADVDQKNLSNVNNNLNESAKDAKDNNLKANLQNNINSYSKDGFSQDSQNLESNSQGNNASTSEDDFLKSFLSQDKDDKNFSKVTTFMNQFSKVSTNTQAIKGEVQVINQNNFAADIVQSVKYMQDSNIKELTVKINPKELGEVVIRLSMENNIMKANIAAENKETYSLLNSSLGDINNSLNNQNIKIQAFSVNIYDDTTYFGGQGGSGNKQDNERKHNNSGRDKDDVIETKSQSDNASLNEARVNMLV